MTGYTKGLGGGLTDLDRLGALAPSSRPVSPGTAALLGALAPSSRPVSPGTAALLGALAPPPRPIRPGAAALLSGLATPTAVSSRLLHWRYVRRRFEAFVESQKMTADQFRDGVTKLRGVVACLNRTYWGKFEEANNRVLIGSWGKRTQVRPPRDIDILFILPAEVYWRFQARTGNRQSELLQEMRAFLSGTYPATDIRGDGQVVVIPFNTCTVEVAPAFLRHGGGYLACDTHDGGRYKHFDPAAEIAVLDSVDQHFNGNVRKLTCLLKQWQRHCNVPIKSFHLEALIMDMLPTVNYGGKDEYWFDWLVRDAFAHLTRRPNSWFRMPVTGEAIFLGDAWLSKAQTAYERALKACAYEHDNHEILAGDEWQKIFGAP